MIITMKKDAPEQEIKNLMESIDVYKRQHNCVLCQRICGAKTDDSQSFLIHNRFLLIV